MFTELNVGQFAWLPGCLAARHACMACCPAINKCISVFFSELPSEQTKNGTQNGTEPNRDEYKSTSIVVDTIFHFLLFDGEKVADLAR